eukprot:3683951-Pleurochrysis_carterae.AAC.3
MASRSNLCANTPRRLVSIRSIRQGETFPTADGRQSRPQLGHQSQSRAKSSDICVVTRCLATALPIPQAFPQSKLVTFIRRQPYLQSAPS